MDAFNKSRLHTEAKESRRLEKTPSKIDERQQFGEQCCWYRRWLIIIHIRPLNQYLSLIIHRSMMQHVSPTMMIQRPLMTIIRITIPVTRGHEPRNHSFNIELFLSVICFKRHAASPGIHSIVLSFLLEANQKHKTASNCQFLWKKFSFFIEDLLKMT